MLRALIQMNELVIVWSYVPRQQGWVSFTPIANSGPLCCYGFGTLSTMDAGVGYWIYVRDSVNITIAGYVIPPSSAPPSFNLLVGWNLLGFKPRPVVQSETVGQYLASISGAYDLNNVWVYDNVNKNWIIANAGTLLAPGEAMWIYMKSAATLMPG